MQSASSRIWTRVAVSISYDDNHYTTGTSRVLTIAYISLSYVHASKQLSNDLRGVTKVLRGWK